MKTKFAIGDQLGSLSVNIREATLILSHDNHGVVRFNFNELHELCLGAGERALMYAYDPGTHRMRAIAIVFLRVDRRNMGTCERTVKICASPMWRIHHKNAPKPPDLPRQDGFFIVIPEDSIRKITHAVSLSRLLTPIEEGELVR